MNYAVIAASIKKTIIGRKTKSIIAALLLVGSSAFAQVPSYVPTNGLVGWWPFNGNANDLSNGGHNGLITGGQFTSDRNGNSNSAILFNSTSTGYVDINLGSNINSQFSVMLWVRADRTSSYISESSVCYGSVSVPMANSNQNWVLVPNNYGTNFGVGVSVVQNGTMVAEHANNVLVSRLSTTNNSTAYNNIIISYRSDSTFLYVNGTLVRARSMYCTSNTKNLGQTIRLGGSMYSPNFAGVIDDIGIWNRALTQQEVISLYTSQGCSNNFINADGPTTFCAGNSVNLTSDVVGGTYQWRRNGVNIATNSTSRTFKASSTGSYTCVATCNGTALTSNTIAVTSKTNASASVTASGATSFCVGDSVTLNCTNLGSNYSVQWYRTNVSMENANAYSQVVKQPGTYKVVTKNLTNGCSRISGSSAIVAVNCRIAGDITSGTPTPLSESEAKFTANELSQGVNIFPNPNNGSFTFAYDGEEYGDAVLQVTNSMGQMIYTTNVNVSEGGYTQELQLVDTATKGIYIVRLMINGNSYDSRVLVR